MADSETAEHSTANTERNETYFLYRYLSDFLLLISFICIFRRLLTTWDAEGR